MEAYHEGTFNASELIGCLASTHSEGKKAYASRSSFSNVNPKTRKLDNNQKQICRHVKENPHPVFPAQNTRKQRIIGKAYAHEALHISQPLESPKEQEKKKRFLAPGSPVKIEESIVLRHSLSPTLDVRAFLPRHETCPLGFRFAAGEKREDPFFQTERLEEYLIYSPTINNNQQ